MKRKTKSVKSDYLNKHFAPVKVEKPRRPAKRVKTWRGWAVVNPDSYSTTPDLFRYMDRAKGHAAGCPKVKVYRATVRLEPVAGKGAKR